MNRLQRFTIGKLFCILLIMLFSSGPQNSEAQERKNTQALDVSVYRVEKPRLIPFELRYPGRTKSVSRVTVVARVSGILQEMLFREGQYVQKNTPLFKIEPDTYQAEYNAAKAAVEQAIAELNRTERDWKRINASFEDRVVSEQQRDTALSAYEKAKAGLEAAKARLKQAEINLRYTDVRSPVSGITGSRFIDIGNMVNPNTPLVTITEINPIYVEFSIPDTDLPKIGRLTEGKTLKVGSPKNRRFFGVIVELLLEGSPYRPTGDIDFIDSVIDEKTSSVNARAVFPNPNGSILPGQFVRIKLKGLQKRATVVVPQKAVFQTPTGPAVYLVKDGKAVIKNIKLGERAGKDFIVNEGLKPGDLVIVDNLLKLRPDMPVRVR